MAVFPTIPATDRRSPPPESERTSHPTIRQTTEEIRNQGIKNHDPRKLRCLDPMASTQAPTQNIFVKKLQKT